MDASDLVARQHRRVLRQIAQLGGKGVARLFALHELMESMLAYMSAVEALAKIAVLRGGVVEDEVAFDEATRHALLELAQSRDDDAWFATARIRLADAFDAQVRRVQSTLLPYLTASFGPYERRVLGAWLAEYYVERRRADTRH